MTPTQLGDETLILDALLSPEECRALIAHSEQRGYSPAPVSQAGGAVLRPELRDNARLMIDAPDTAKTLWRRLAPQLEIAPWGERPVGLNERLRFYRYRPGELFDWHRDGFYRRSPTERSRLTLLIYLNAVEGGGATELPPHAVEPREGRALVFPHSRVHRGAPVERGVKYVLRSDVMYAELPGERSRSAAPGRPRAHGKP
jgi:hypothetical protein